MAGASSALNANGFDAFIDGSYDPSIADAVNRLEIGSGLTPPTAITNVIAQSVDDAFITTTLTLTSGTAQVTLMPLIKGQVVTNINLNSGAASVAQTHLWAAITAAGTVGTCLAVTTDGGTTPTGGTTVQKMVLTAPWTVPSTGLYYVHVCATGTTTLPTFDAFAASAGVRGTQAPIVSGTAATGLTVAPTVGSTTLGGAITVTKGLAIWLN